MHNGLLYIKNYITVFMSKNRIERRTVTKKDMEIIAKGDCPICGHTKDLMRMSLDDYWDLDVKCSNCGNTFKGTEAKNIMYLYLS